MKLPAVPPGQIVHAEVKLSPGNILTMEEYAELLTEFKMEVAFRERDKREIAPPNITANP
jgi:hypothetical protein